MPMQRHPGTHHFEWQMHEVWVKQYRSSGKGRKHRVKWIKKYKRFHVRVPNDI